MKKYVTQQNVELYELLFPLLEAAYNEIQELSEKKPESPLNSYKVKSINRIIIPLKELLSDETVYDFLDVLDTDDFPTNSDVILILSQYKKAMSMFKSTYQIYDSATYSDKWNFEPSKQTSIAQQKQKK